MEKSRARGAFPGPFPLFPREFDIFRGNFVVPGTPEFSDDARPIGGVVGRRVPEGDGAISEGLEGRKILGGSEYVEKIFKGKK